MFDVGLKTPLVIEMDWSFPGSGDAPKTTSSIVTVSAN